MRKTHQNATGKVSDSWRSIYAKSGTKTRSERYSGHPWGTPLSLFVWGLYTGILLLYIAYFLMR
jgi:hypothetical protein